MQLYKNDEFTIELKIKSLTKDYTTIYYQSSDNYPEFNMKNVSFTSYDGKTWTDMAENYKAVVSLKAYTLQTPQIETTTNLKGNVLNITTKITNNNKKATITYKLGNQIITREIKQNATIQATMNIANITTKNTLKTTYTSDEYIIESETDYKNQTEITINQIPTAHMGNEIKIKGTLKSITGQTINAENITVTLNTKNYTVKTDTKGNYIFKTIADKLGTNIVKITYDGNEKYYESNNTITFNVTKKVSLLTLGSTTNIPIKDNVCIFGKLMADNVDAPNEEITLNIAGKSYTVKTNQYGNYKLYVTTTELGENTITATYAGSKTNTGDSNTTTFTVNKRITLLTLGSTSEVFIGSKVCVYGKLLINGIDAPYEEITVYCNGESYTVKTTQYGNYKLYVTTEYMGENSIYANYDGSELNYESYNSTIFVVKDKKSTLLTLGCTSKVFVGDKVCVYGKLMSNGVDAPYEEIDLYYNDEKYTVKTSQYGNYRLYLKVNNIGNYGISAVYNGSEANKYSYNSTVFSADKKSSLLTLGCTSEVLVGSKVCVYGKLQVNGIDAPYENITVYCNGESYTVKTSQYGNYKLYVTAEYMGENSIYANYDGSETIYANYNSTSFNVVGKKSTLLTLGSTSGMSLGSNVCIFGKLMSDGVDVPYETVSLSVAGKSYTVTTSQYGNYRIYIPTTILGKNTITAKYAGSNQYYASNNSTYFTVK